MIGFIYFLEIYLILLNYIQKLIFKGKATGNFIARVEEVQI